MVRTVQVPRNLYQPFPLETSPHYPRLVQVINSWAQTSGIVNSKKATERFVKADFSYLTATTFSRAPWDELVLIAKFLVLLFMLDDQVDDAALGYDADLVKEVLWDLFSTMDERGTPISRKNLHRFMGSAYKRAYSQWWQEIIPLSDRDWRQRFRITMAQYFESYVNEARNRTDKRIPVIEEAILLRRNTGAVKPVFLLIELEQNLHNLTPEILSHPTIQTLENYANDIICWANDIFSVDKEKVKGDISNLVLALENEKRSDTTQEAADKVASMLEERTKDFERLRNINPSKKIYLPDIAKLHPEFSSTHVELVTEEMYKYIDGLQLWIPGNYAWSLMSARYSNEEINNAKNIDYVENILQINSEGIVTSMKPEFDMNDKIDITKTEIRAVALSA